VHGQEDIVVAKFLEACNVNTVSLERLDENRMLRWQIDIGPNVPNKYIDIYGFRLTKRFYRRAEPKLYTPRISEDAMATAKPVRKKRFQYERIKSARGK
jgi:hypothetical protein